MAVHSNLDATTYSSKKEYFYKFKTLIKQNGGAEFWVLNKQNGEIYRFKGTQVSDFDVAIDLFNTLEQEHIITITSVIHMKDNIINFFEEVPGKIYLNKLDCYRELYQYLIEKLESVKSSKLKMEMEDKIEFIELTFPEFLI
jgi:hypothetical protein